MARNRRDVFVVTILQMGSGCRRRSLRSKPSVVAAAVIVEYRPLGRHEETVTLFALRDAVPGGRRAGDRSRSDGRVLALQRQIFHLNHFRARGLALWSSEVPYFAIAFRDYLDARKSVVLIAISNSVPPESIVSS